MRSDPRCKLQVAGYMGRGARIMVVLFLMLVSISFGSAAHYIIGYVNDASDSVSPNGEEILLWNSSLSEETGITSIIGPSGPSYQSNFYMIDCELMDSPCQVGDNLTLKVKDAGFGRTSGTVNLIVTSAAYDMADNLTLNAPVVFDSIVVDDSFNLTANEIDLVANSTRLINCETVVNETDSEKLVNVRSEFFDSVTSFLGDVDDNNHHYTNTTCQINSSYGEIHQSLIKCSYELAYYANSNNWNCQMNVGDKYFNTTGNDLVFVNPLLSVGIQDNVTFENGVAGEVSDEVSFEIYNYGNTEIDLSLYGYGLVPGDNLAMDCGEGDVISIENKKYNLTSSNFGELTLSETENFYKNLTGNPFIEDVNLGFRQNDLVNNAFMNAYFRIFVPEGIGGTCEGNIVFGAVSSV